MNKNSNVSHGRKTFLCFSEILTDQPTNQPTDGYEGYTSKEEEKSEHHFRTPAVWFTSCGYITKI